MTRAPRPAGRPEGATTSPAKDSPAPVLPPHVTMGLLDHIASTALDADYAVVAQRRGGDERRTHGGRRGSTAARAGRAAVLMVFALLLSVAAVQTARSERVSEAGQRSLLDQVDERRDRLADARTDLAGLRREVATLRRTQLTGTEAGRALQGRLRTLGAAVGARPVTGPGMVVTVDDALDARSDRERVLDGDLQRLVNGLWAAGAEAIAINGQRLTQLSAIRTAGEAIHVNFRPLRPPYVVSAIGNPDQLPARFIETRGGAWWLNLRAVYEVRFDMSSREEILLPAVGIDDLRLARVPEPAP